MTENLPALSDASDPGRPHLHPVRRTAPETVSDFSKFSSALSQNTPPPSSLLRRGEIASVQSGEQLAADDVAAALADIAVGSPVNGTVELAGPEVSSIAAFVGRYLAASGDTRVVLPDSQARYYGAALDDRGLTPTGTPRIGPTGFEAWIGRSGSQV